MVPVAQKLDSSFAIGFANTYRVDVAIQRLKTAEKLGPGVFRQ